MKLWTFQRFQEPRLCVDAIEHEKGTAIVSLRSKAQTYRIAFDDDEAAAQVAGDLTSLRDSNAPLWTTLRESSPNSSWHALGNFLDSRSLVGDTREGAAAALRGQLARVRDCVDQTRTAVLARLPTDRRTIVAEHAAELRRGLYPPNTARSISALNGDPFDPAVQPNFFLALLTVEFEYLRRFAPLTLAATDLLLGSIAEEGESERMTPISPFLSDTAGLYDERDLATHLWLVGSSLMSSSSEGASRLYTEPIPTHALTSGLEFMRQTEMLARATLIDWGENPYVTAINKLGGLQSPLVAGPFIEQYHVTRRFVEMIAPLLSRRLSAPLRSQLFRYYAEESGHEALESTTCQALGVAEAALGKALPLPLHFAFVDALTLFADIDPITSFAAVMTIEGLFGEPPRMSLRLVAAARHNEAFRSVASEHDELNETLNHNSISRDLFEQITAVSPDQQYVTMRRILFLLELNHRAWGDIVGFYGQQDQLWLQGAFGQRLATQGDQTLAEQAT